MPNQPRRSPSAPVAAPVAAGGQRPPSRRLSAFVFAAAMMAAVATGMSTARECRADDAAEAMAEAKRQFAAGVNLLDDPDGAKYEEALAAFKKAYELSHSVKVLGNIGFCALHLERDGEAIDAYSSYLRDAPDIEEKERNQIQRDIATLTSTSARFKAVVKERGTGFVLVDTRTQTRGAAITNTYPIEGTELTVRVRPGRHSFKLKSSGAESAAFEISLDPASQGSHDFSFPVAPPAAPTPVVVTRPSEEHSARPSAAGPVLVGALGLVAIGAGVTTGLLARSTTSDIEGRCPNDVCPRDYDFADDKSKAKTLATIADVSFIGGGVLLGGAVLWYLLQPRGSTRTGSAPPGWFNAGCTGQGCGFALRRGF